MKRIFFLSLLLVAGCKNDETSGGVDSGVVDTGVADLGTVDAGSPDEGTADLGTVDAGDVDLGLVDAATEDALVVDASAEDAGAEDAAVVEDAGSEDAGAFLSLGDHCSGSAIPCGPGLSCCYPCGIPGCMNECTVTCSPGDPGCGGEGCYLYP